MRFYLDKEDNFCLRDSETNIVLCRTKREFETLKKQINKFLENSHSQEKTQ